MSVFGKDREMNYDWIIPKIIVYDMTLKSGHHDL